MKPNFIAGQWLDSAASVANINPSDTRDTIDHYAQADAGMAEAAIAAAHEAKAAWGFCSPQARADALDRIGAEIARREELGRLLSREEGKTLPEGIGEVTRAGNIFKFYAGEALRQRGDKLASVRPGIEIDVTREPVGTVGIIAPWNFPIAIPAWKIAPALAYGNTVVFKPAELVPGCAWALAEIISRAGLPAGVFNLVMGRGSQVGQALLDDRRIDAISFTGSVATGRRVAQAATQRMAKAQLEMGGKNPMVVLDDADLDVAVECAVQSAFYSTGQRCTASSRIIVEQGVYARFLQKLRDRAARSGSATRWKPEPTSALSPAATNWNRTCATWTSAGRKARGCCAAAASCNSARRATTWRPPSSRTATTPCASAASRSRRSCRHATTNTRWPLPTTRNSAQRHLFNVPEARAALQRHAQAGMVMVNVPTAGVDYHVPFGGRKGSSLGSREQGSHAIEFYTTVKTAYVAG